MTQIATVVIETPLCGANPDDNSLAVCFNFSETQITVSCTDEQTGKQQKTQLLFDGCEVSSSG